MEKFFQYTNLILAIGVILVWVTVVIMIFAMWLGSKIENERFFKAAKRSLEFKDIDKIKDGIRKTMKYIENAGLDLKVYL